MQGYEAVYKEKGILQKDVSKSIIKVAPFFKQKKVRTILDLGCGTGRNTRYLKDYGFEVVGIDVSESAIKLGKETNGDISFLSASMTELPFLRDSFDAIVCNHVLQHSLISDIEKAFLEMERVLKKEGLLFLEVTSTESSKFFIGEEIEPNTKINVGGSDGHVPHHFFTESELKTLLKKSSE